MSKMKMTESSSDKLLNLKASLGAHAKRLIEGPEKENPQPYPEAVQQEKIRKAAEKRARKSGCRHER